MTVPCVETDDSPELRASYRIAAADKDAFERERLGSSHEWAAWLRAVDVQFVQPDDEPGESPSHLLAVVLYQPDRTAAVWAEGDPCGPQAGPPAAPPANRPAGPPANPALAPRPAEG